MDIPDTPEGLFEALAEPTIRHLFPNFDALLPRNQKLLRLLHTEMTKGELTDTTFQEFLGFTVVLWRSFNQAALEGNEDLIATEPEIDTDWVDTAIHLARMDQYLHGVLTLLSQLPGREQDTHKLIRNAQYLLQGPGDF